MNAILGSMRRIDERRGAVRVENVYDTDLADLWSAITEPERSGPLDRHRRGRPECRRRHRGAIHQYLGRAGAHRRLRPPNHLVLTMELGTDDEA